MAQVTEVVLTCDVHDGNSEAIETITFTVEGQSYEFELCEDHLAEFREAMEVWSSHARSGRPGRSARRAGRSARRDPGAGAAPSAGEVREWARSQGMEVSSRGRVGADVRAAYDAAH